MTKVILLLVLIPFQIQQVNYEIERMRMVNNQIKSRGVRDAETLRAMKIVPRHLFVPEEFRKHAYADGPLPIGYEQTISQPYIVAYMTEKLKLESDDRVLEIGTGSGYQAAILSEIVAEVFTIEIVRPLAKAAKVRLQELGYNNVKVFAGDGYNGLKNYSPFDAIMVTAGADHIPQPLVKQLANGGKMIIPVGSHSYTQYLVLVEKDDGKVKTKKLLPVRFVPFTRDEE